MDYFVLTLILALACFLLILVACKIEKKSSEGELHIMNDPEDPDKIIYRFVLYDDPEKLENLTVCKFKVIDSREKHSL